jgi:hypothetical protein
MLILVLEKSNDYFEFPFQLKMQTMNKRVSYNSIMMLIDFDVKSYRTMRNVDILLPHGCVQLSQAFTWIQQK